MKLAGVAALVMALLLPVHAHAAYPGQNGKIAYAVVGGLKTMNPDGTGQAQLTTGEDLESGVVAGRAARRVRAAP